METMLKFLIAIGVVLLMAVLFYTVKIHNAVAPVLSPEEQAIEFEKSLDAKEKAFFTKYANISARDEDGNQIRTVTMSLAVQQAILVQRNSSPEWEGQKPSKPVPPPPKGRITYNENPPWQLQGSIGEDGSQDQQQVIKFNNAFTGYVSANCPSATIDFDQLVTGDTAYSNLVSSIIAPGTLGVACICPNGEGYCNWSSEMFEQFIVDTDIWDLVSIEIFDITSGNILSTSSMSQIVNSPRNHMLVTMSNPAVLQNLNTGDKIVALFKWLDKVTREQRCIELFNKMP